MTAFPDPAQIRELLNPETPWRDVSVVTSTGSTNADLSAQARAGAEGWAALIATEQTAGRGRLGRPWASPPGASLSMSLLLYPRPAAMHWGWLSLLAGMAVAAAIEELASDVSRVQLKWPNDVLIDGRKVCGILSERVDTSTGSAAVIGIGINVALTEEQLPVPNATSLVLAGFEVDQSRLVAGVLTHFAHHFEDWQMEGNLQESYSRQCASIGVGLTVHLAHQQVTGTGVGVDQLGRLQVATADGQQTFAVGDVVHAKLA